MEYKHCTCLVSCRRARWTFLYRPIRRKASEHTCHICSHVVDAPTMAAAVVQNVYRKQIFISQDKNTIITRTIEVVMQTRRLDRNCLLVQRAVSCVDILFYYFDIKRWKLGNWLFIFYCVRARTTTISKIPKTFTNCARGCGDSGFRVATAFGWLNNCNRTWKMGNVEMVNRYDENYTCRYIYIPIYIYIYACKHINAYHVSKFSTTF